MIAAGFGIDQVNVSGQHYASDNDVYDALDLTNVKTFAAFNSEAVLKRIERIPWIDKVQMTRVYPGTLDIVVRERTPALIWTRGNENYLVDATGRVLGPTPAANSWTLPRVVGEGAKDDATLMLAAVRRYPAIESQYAYGDRVGERRWRIVLKNGTMLELAADRETEGLQEIASAPAIASALTGTPMIVDVRTPGRITMRPLDGKLATNARPTKSSGAPLYRQLALAGFFMADRRTYRTFGLLDIGTSKTVAAVIVAEHSPSAGSRRCGSRVLVCSVHGHQSRCADGSRRGRIGRSRAFSAQAERAAGISVGDFTLSVAAGPAFLRSLHGADRRRDRKRNAGRSRPGSWRRAKVTPNAMAAR